MKIDFGVWGLENTFGPPGPKDVSSNKSRTLASTFTNRTSFSQESWDESNKIIKSQKILDLGAWGLKITFGPSYLTCIWRLLANELFTFTLNIIPI